MSSEPRDCLAHMLLEMHFLQETVARTTRDAFLKDEVLKRAFCRSLEIIGEAARQVPDAMKVRHPGIAWREMSGMRNHLIHGYFGVDYDIVWDVAATEIPQQRILLTACFETKTHA